MNAHAHAHTHTDTHACMHAHTHLYRLLPLPLLQQTLCLLLDHLVLSHHLHLQTAHLTLHSQVLPLHDLIEGTPFPRHMIHVHPIGGELETLAIQDLLSSMEHLGGGGGRVTVWYWYMSCTCHAHVMHMSCSGACQTIHADIVLTEKNQSGKESLSSLPHHTNDSS